MSTIIGRRIRQLRTEQHKTLKELSEATNLSIGYLSKIEREDYTVSEAVLTRIANALGVNIQIFFEGPSITRSFERRNSYVDAEMISVEFLSVHPEKFKLAATIVNVLPFNTIRPMKPHSHGGEELVYILEGVLSVILDDRKFDLYPGDTLHFSAEHTHLWMNNTNKMVRFFNATTHPADWETYVSNLAPLLAPVDCGEEEQETEDGEGKTPSGPA